MPQGPGCDRRDAGGVQVDRRGHEGAGGPRGGRPHAQAGRLREGLGEGPREREPR